MKNLKKHHVIVIVLLQWWMLKVLNNDINGCVIPVSQKLRPQIDLNT